MDTSVKELLAVVGAQLDQLIFPRVKNGGFVVPRDSAISLNHLGVEKHHEQQRQAGSSTQSRQRAGRGARQAGGCESSGSRTPAAAAPVVGQYARDSSLAQLNELEAAYPETQIWDTQDGFWLYARSHLLPGLNRSVIFVVGVSNASRQVRAWAFWTSGSVGASWIGPRHTNFPDGSICAFEPQDGTWTFGDSFVTLLDLYTGWAFRHLHLEVMGRWPGPQAGHWSYERIMEVAADEHCPCGMTGRLYADCCQPKDLSGNRLRQALIFAKISKTPRCPPASVQAFALERKQVPSLSTLVEHEPPAPTHMVF